jgi:hypothetical protein
MLTTNTVLSIRSATALKLELDLPLELKRLSGLIREKPVEMLPVQQTGHRQWRFETGWKPIVLCFSGGSRRHPKLVMYEKRHVT